jgi:putative CocE/NonD family hydrolase
MKRSGAALGRVAFALVLAVVAAGLAGSRAGAGPSDDASVPAWMRYDRPAKWSAVDQEVRVPMRDGVGMRCTLTRPAKHGVLDDGSFPALVLNFFAYRALQMTAFQEQAEWFATRGYAVLACSPRGSGGTPGEWRPFEAQERSDLYDLIEWAGRQAWSSGKVGQTGVSYGGISTYKAVTSGAPHLTAAAPIVAYSDVYSEIVYPGGIRGTVLRWWPFTTWVTSVPGDHPDTATARFPDYIAFDERVRQHPYYDDYWRSLAVDTKAVHDSPVPILGIGGWHDLFPKGMVDNYLAGKDHSWLVMLPWAHGRFTPGQRDFPVVNRMLLAWFDHWLLGRPDAPLPSAPVTSWQLPAHSGHWTELAGWPPSGATPLALHLNGDRTLGGTAGTAATLPYEVNPYDNGCSCVDHGLYGAPDDPQNDQRLADGTRLHFDSAPLPADTVIAGEPVADLRAALSTADGNLVVRLEDVAADGSSSVVTTGWLRASHRLGHEHPVALQPGTPYDFTVPLWPTHWNVAAGHRLRVSVSSGDLATIEPNAPPGTVSVLAGVGGSRLTLPVANG